VLECLKWLEVIGERQADIMAKSPNAQLPEKVPTRVVKIND
jgi:hypothetical protein